MSEKVSPATEIGPIDGKYTSPSLLTCKEKSSDCFPNKIISILSPGPMT
ncbi:uncharacterized protein METZ01_LOCUS245332 [marine metagenome]|uniref:Uncharacterized protein n=1 Tax=marine metagenome TaxID=408172 RepID=A0A382HYW1_9ZZZZ